MAKCSYCEAETQLYDSSSIPICLTCSNGKPPAPPQDFLTVLYQDVVEATARVRSASNAISSTMADIPSTPPPQDATQRICSAATQLTVARNEMMRACSRFNDFLTQGIVPEDLKRSG